MREPSTWLRDTCVEDLGLTVVVKHYDRTGFGLGPPKRSHEPRRVRSGAGAG